jgi:uncharacterized protein (TIGR03067 family)
MARPSAFHGTIGALPFRLEWSIVMLGRCTISVVVGFVGAVVLSAGDSATELKKLQGQWACIAAEKSGKKAPPEILKFAATFSGDKMYFDTTDAEKKDGANKREFSIILDPTKKPHWIDLVKISAEGKGDRSVGIYKLVGDELTICVGEKNVGRPEEFAAPEGSNLNLITFIPVCSLPSAATPLGPHRPDAD